MSFIIAVLKTRDLTSIRNKLFALYILNITDIVFTLFLINTGMFLEINAVMAPLVNNIQLLGIFIKIIIPLVLILWVYQRMRKATAKQLYQSNIIIVGCLVLYGLINMSHIIWSILYTMINVSLL